MTRAIRLLLVASVFCFVVSPVLAQQDADDEDTIKKAPSRAELLATKLKFSPEYTRVTKHRTKAGLPDYEAAINEHFGEGVKPEENGAISLYQALGPKPEGGLMPERFFTLMGMPRPPENAKYFEGFGRSLPPEQARILIDGAYSIAMNRPWTRKEFPEIARWLSDNAVHVEKVIQGSKRPKYYSPIIVPRDDNGESQGLVASLLPGIQMSREIARYLICRAMLNISEGKPDAAWSDLMAMHRIGCMIGKGPTLIEGLVGVAINQIAAKGDLIFLDQVEMTAERLSQCRRDIASLPPVVNMAEQLDWCERMMYLDSVMLLGTGRTEILGTIEGRVPEVGDEGALQAIVTRLVILSVDWNTALKTGNELYDHIVVTMKKKSFSEREAGLSEIDARVEKARENTSFSGFLKVVSETGSSRAAMSEMVANVMVALLLPAVRAVNTADERSEQGRRNLQIAFALADWKLQNGSYPETLQALVPKHLDRVPLDGFSGKDMIYRSTGDGYLLYSVGPNKMDEGGRWYEDEPRGDDPRVRIPIPAEEYTREDL